MTRQANDILEALVVAKGKIVKMSVLAKFLPRAKAKNFGSLKVAICILRKQLKPHGVRLHTQYGVGYGIDQYNYEKLMNLRLKGKNNAKNTPL